MNSRATPIPNRNSSVRNEAIGGSNVAFIDRVTRVNKKARASEDASARLTFAQYSFGRWITFLAKYSVISSSVKSVCSISCVNTMLSWPSSRVIVAIGKYGELRDLKFLGCNSLVAGLNDRGRLEANTLRRARQPAARRRCREFCG
jgi:hypothetical protein